MLGPDELISLIFSWRMQTGDFKYGKYYVPTKGELRVFAYEVLVKTLAETHGYIEDEVREDFFKIIDLSYNKSHKPKEEREDWRQACITDLNTAIALVFQQNHQLASVDPNKPAPKRVPRPELKEVEKYKKQEYVLQEVSKSDDAENLLDRSIFKDLPPVIDTVADIEFLKKIQKVIDE